MTRSIRLFLILEGVSFGVAGLIHSGLLIAASQDPAAAIAESTIAVVLLVAYVLTWLWPTRTRAFGIAAQGFALALTLIGAYVSIVGVGPHTVLDVVFHVGILLVLVWGLVVALRDPSSPGGIRTTMAIVVQTLIRATGLLQLVLGLALWTGTLLVALPFHMFNGLFFVLLIEIVELVRQRVHLDRLDLMLSQLAPPRWNMRTPLPSPRESRQSFR